MIAWSPGAGAQFFSEDLNKFFRFIKADTVLCAIRCFNEMSWHLPIPG